MWHELGTVSAPLTNPLGETLEQTRSPLVLSRRNLGLLGVALFAFCLICGRAYSQSMTIDEVDSYVYFITGLVPGFTHWQPHSNNHVLNTLIMHLSTSLFGVTNLTMRSSAIFGAALYIVAVTRFCFLVCRTALLRIALFVCLVMNPFVMDYLVAARGYSMAMGFLFTAIFLICRDLLSRDRSVQTGSKLLRQVSILLSLSFTANFSFAYVDFWTLALFALWCIWNQHADSFRLDMQALTRMLGSAILPGLIVAFLIAGYTARHMPKAQLVYGSQSLQEMWEAMVSCLFFQLNPQIVNPTLMRWLSQLNLVWPTAVTSFVVINLLAIRKWRNLLSEHEAKMQLIPVFLLAVLALTLLTHWLAFEMFGLLLPKNRTSIFFVILFIAAFGVLCAEARPFLKPASIAVLVIAAVYFVACIRTTYFQEWRFNAHSDRNYKALKSFAFGQHLLKVPTNWRFISVFNYYRLIQNDQTFAGFSPAFQPSEFPLNQPLYVFSLEDERDLITSRHLRIVYQDDLSQLAIAAP